MLSISTAILPQRCLSCKDPNPKTIAFEGPEHPIPPERRCRGMSLLWIILVVVVVLALLGFFGRGRAW
jgi:hypothetical protein